MGAKIVIRNPFLSAITYDLCYGLSPDAIKKLSIKYRRMFASNIKVKNFCERASLDERVHFFNEIGASTGFTVFFDKVKSSVSLKEILQKYEEEKLASAQQQHANLGVYVTTDKETAFMLGLMSQTINTASYLRALDFNKTGYHIKNWGKRLDTPIQEETLEAINNVGVVLTTVLSTGITFDVVNDLFGLNDIEVKILMYFYKYRQSYISKDAIDSYFVGYLAKHKITRALKKLLLNNYIRKHADWKLHKQTITADGIKIVNDFLSRVLKANEF
jgi:hypothetical protein